VFPNHHEDIVSVQASPEAVFAFVDDHSKLSSHMGKRAWMMGGGAMVLTTDAMHGQAVGSKLELAGSAWGLRLRVAELVTVREPPWRKVWETIGTPRLLVIGPYRMGVEVERRDAMTQLRVFIDYALPAAGFGRWLGRRLARRYASWCTSAMARDAAAHFRLPAGAPRAAA
jgi:hypothetical protein